VIHLERVALPQGLRAVAYRDKRGNLIIYLSETLDATCQRAAVVEAIRASRRKEWRRGGLPSAAIVLLLGIRTVLWRAATAVKLRPLAWGAAATTAVAGASAAGVFITAVPHHPAPPPSAARSPEPSAVQPLTPRGQPPGQPAHQVRARAGAIPSRSAGRGQDAAAARPTPTPSVSPTPSPVPSASPSPTEPSPSPSPSTGICVVTLGIRVCV
jgi:hypothetical protein